MRLPWQILNGASYEMGKIIKPSTVKLITGFIFSEEIFYRKSRDILEKAFAEIDFESKNLKFYHTDYYQKEIGTDLKRKFVSFKKLIGLAKVVLASTKDYKHRIYLDKGIYAEITLFYQDKTFNPWEWTYPDYRTDE